ncbi:hypothetical protein B9Z47_09600 [Limnohabitans sp. 2KL-1]|uniref:beta strand repeat-containing protein n=1 Tax=Limnohabitans sp. 2KL-1 TaxID=1100699 RepID=UPI000D3C0695|nr:hypothetical protein [Limnohabitans sp. 2KL-1]PUE48078.1 hypothetical protein B9Z47_09600 [Limnohabitans sp. 2KL-1]
MQTQVTLELDLDEAVGNNLRSKLTAGGVAGVTGITIDDLGNANGALGVDIIDLQGSGLLQIDLQDVQELIDGGLKFSLDDQITLQLGADAYIEGTFLKTSSSGQVLLSSLGNGAEGVGVDVLDLFGQGTLTIDETDALGLINAGLSFNTDDQITLGLGEGADIEGTFLKTSSGGQVLLSSLGNGPEGVGVDVLDLFGQGTLTIDETDALGLINAGLSFAGNDQITLDIQSEGTYLGSKLASAGLTLGALGNAQDGVGVDILDIGGAGTAGAVTINEADAFDLVTGGLSFAVNDTVTLDLQSEGTYLSSKLASAGLTLGALGNAQDGVGVDILDIGGAGTAGAVTINEADVLDLINAGLSFAGNDQITLGLGEGADIEGTFLKTSSSGQVLLSSLGNGAEGVGVDVLDLFGQGTLTIDETDALGLINAGLSFNTDDQITLGLGEGADIEGTFLKTSSGGQVLLSSLGNGPEGVGVDVLDLFGQGTLTIDETDALGLINAGLSFNTNDQITLDIQSEGTYLGSKLASAGLTLGALGNAQDGVGVDILDIGGAGTAGAVTINEADAFDLVTGGLSFAVNDTVTLDLQSEGTYLSSKLASAGLTLGALGNAQDGVGVDILDIGGAGTAGAVTINEADVLDLINAGLSFADNDTVTLDVAGDSTIEGTYLRSNGGTLTPLSGLAGFGIDLFDLGGPTQQVDLRITEDQANALGGAGLGFAANDTVTLDLSVDDLQGTYLGNKLSAGGLAGVPNIGFADLGNQSGGIGIDVLDMFSDAALISETDALGLINAGLSFADNDTVTLDIQSEGTYLGSKLASAGLTLGALGNAQDGVGVDILDIGGAGTAGAVTINEADAFDLVAGGLSFADNDTVTLDLQSEGTYLSSKLASAGLTLGALGNAQDGVGVDILDIGGAEVAAVVKISGADAQALIDNGLTLAMGDMVTLESQVDGTFLNSRMNYSSWSPLGQLSSDMGGVGVDLVEIFNGQTKVADFALGALGAVRIDEADALGLINAGLNFANSEQVTLDVNLPAGDVDGTYLGGKLAAAGLGIHTLGPVARDTDNDYFADQFGLGVDILDIGGADVAAAVKISGADAQALIDNGLTLAMGDMVTLESQVDGTFLNSRINSWSFNPLGHLSSDMGGVGVDQVNIFNGQTLVADITVGTYGELQIDNNDARGLITAGLSFSSYEQVTLDATAITDGQVLGTFLGNNLLGLGVDEVVVLKEALSGALTDPQDQWDAPWELIDSLQPNLGFKAAPTIKVAVDSEPTQDINDPAVQMAAEIQSIANDLISAGVQFDTQGSFGDLMAALTGAVGNVDQAFDSAMFSQGLQDIAAMRPTVSGFVAQSDDNVVMSDELAKALADAGMFEAVPQARVEIDGGANLLLLTPLQLLAQFGVDKVTSEQDTLYLQVGNIANLQEMGQALQGLLEGTQNQPLFHNSQGDVADAGLLLDASHSDLVNGLLSADAVEVLQSLQQLGIQQLDLEVGVVAQTQIADVSTPVTVLGVGYESIDLQKLLDKHNGA